MKVNVDLRLKDIPGQLVWALEPISTYDGNIMGVVHHHDVVVGGRITVNVTFEVRSEESLQKILDTWKIREIDVAKMGHHFETFPVQYLLVGTISPGELQDLAKKLESVEDLASVDIRYSGSATSERKSAMITGKVTKKEAIKTLNNFFQSWAEKSGFLLIRGFSD